MDDLNYESDIRIDQDALDVEWLEQPRMVFVYSKNLAFRKRLLEKVTQEIALVKAEIDKEVRQSPELFNVNVKLTETVVNNTIIQQKKYVDIYNEYVEAKYEVNIAQAAVNAMEHRKSALENLVRLFGQQYFAGPTIPRDLSKEWEQKQRQKNVDKKVGNVMKRRKN